MNKTLDKLYKADVQIYMDHVIVFGEKVWKPSGVSVSQWLTFWERVQRMQLHVE